MTKLCSRIDYLDRIAQESIQLHFPKMAFSNSGNLGIFCQSESEFEEFSKVAAALILSSSNSNQKYFELKNPIVIENQLYTYIYIRKYDSTDYGQNLGDIDFYLPNEEFADLLRFVESENTNSNISIYLQDGQKMIQIAQEDVLTYISTLEITMKVRIKQN